MHLHAWNSPPIRPLTADDYYYQPYLVEYPEEVIWEKVEFMTRMLENTFSVKMTSHRAGRWSMDKVYVRALIELGYRVDCSVTPHVSWRRTLGNPAGRGGTDYSRFPDEPYRIDPEDIGRPGDSPLLEVPMTVMNNSGITRSIGDLLPPGSLPSRAWNRFFPPRSWLQPNGRNLRSMLRIQERALQEGRRYVEFTLHSSEFMPGGSPTFPSGESIEKLYDHLDQLFARAAQNFAGLTLTEFEQTFSCSGASAKANV
jgi:hypothetical protein